ncbi:MAG: hypothetical protein NUW01_19115 [Gemmatimonadaceae bacterium]|nr:hypothetical protein [Gemmatimonadaceae bacterium]
MSQVFHAGQHGDIGGVEWRVVTGRKAPGDLRLDVRAVRFIPVKMDLGFLFADFYAQNERVLYPHRGDEAGDRYVNFIRGAMYLGWQDAAEQLAFERAEAAARRAA